MKVFLIRIGFIFLLLLFGSSISKSQNDAHEQAVQFRNKAMQAAAEEKYKDAVQFINQCSEAAAKSDNPETEALCKLAAADIYLMRHDQSSALIYRLQAAEIYKTSQNAEMLYAIYTDLAETYFFASAYEKAKEYYQRAFENAQPTQAQLFDYHFRTGNCLFEEKDYERAALKYDFAYSHAVQVRDTARMHRCLTKQIRTYKAVNQYDSVIAKQQLLLDIYRHRKDKLNESSTLNNMAYAYVFTDDYKNALNYFKESVEMAENLNLPDSFFISSYLNIGICYQNTDEIENSLEQLNRAYKTAQKSNHAEYAALAARLIALTYFEDGDLYNALTFGEMAVSDAEKTNNEALKRDIYRDYSKILQSANDYENALNYYKKHLSIRDSLLLKDMIDKKELESLMAELEKAEQNLHLQLADQKVKDLAMKEMKLKAEKREQRLQLLEKEKELDEAERRRIAAALELARQQKEALKKENEITELRQQKKIQELELERKAANEKKKEQELKLLEAEQAKQAERESLMQWMMALGTLILLIIVLFLINSRRKNKKLAWQKRQIEESNDELNQQKEEIKSQNEFLAKANTQITKQKEEIQIINTEMTDSIIYAQRIQQAVMPSAALLSAYCADSFILYKPRDIVSGDFYWFKEINNKLIFTAADCTGHGVPGAFMSMLGISFLNEITNKETFTNAADILDQLRDMVITALKQSGAGEKRKDGMDMSLCIIDKETQSMDFAGANNPLLLVRKGKEERIKADRMPIGSHHRQVPFKNITIKLEKDDCFYLYSDGYQDQFGGKHGRKFLSKRFRQVLADNSRLPFSKQKTVLEETFQDWLSYTDSQGRPYRQVDDIIIIGFRV